MKTKRKEFNNMSYPLDINQVLYGNEMPPELSILSAVLTDFVDTRSVDDTLSRFQLMFLIAALLNWKEDDLYDLVGYANALIFNRETGISTSDFVAAIRKSQEKSTKVTLHRVN
ncbi:hypothetical protein EII15_21155 [Bacillus licheniformis]|uniref:hypothetical protein n=1 Tax=Bacillus licheniformis TaxID=1402 RepID=UPI000F5ED49F|nr:hypothetical protein [Bacillus licheniformis]RRD95608.1 hypothetical protein EII15_21155 [Bacillus licheniformis]